MFAGMDGETGHILRALADLLLPRTCVVCGGTLDPEERFLCIRCRADFPRTRFATLPHNPMADRFNGRIDDPGIYVQAAALFYFSAEAGYRRIPYALKYEGNLAAGKYFARQLGRDLAASPLFAGVDAVVPVPLHRWRRHRRGYNQAEVIAREVARTLGAVPVGNWLVRRRRTRSQTRLTVEEKLANVHSAFSPSRKGREAAARPPEQLPRHILLVDDVFTTGATLAACHAALRDLFPSPVRISVATLAFVGGT